MRATEERLSRQESLVTLGALAAGVGQEINNPLTYILGNLAYALDELRPLAASSPTERLRELIGLLEEAHGGSERVRQIVLGLSALARRDSEPLPTDVGNVIDLAISMAAHETREKATVARALAETPPAVTDESRLAQVLVNLIVNAAQAFPSGDAANNRITVASSLEADGRVCIAVSDNGPGVLPRVRVLLPAASRAASER